MKVQHEGEEIEVFTHAEVEAQINAKGEEMKTQISGELTEKYKDYDDVKAKAADFEAKLVETQLLLSAAENDPAKKAQIERLRAERDAAKSSVEELNSVVSTQINQLRSEFIGDYKGELLAQVAGSDEELKKKISLEFDRYRPADNTREDVKARMERAVILATGEAQAAGLFQGGVLTGGAGAGDKQLSTVHAVSESAVSLGDKLGITAEQRKKYSPDNKK